MHALLRQPKIRQLQMPRRVQHQILRLQIPMDDVEFVQMFDSEHDFGEVEFGRLLL